MMSKQLLLKCNCRPIKSVFSLVLKWKLIRLGKNPEPNPYSPKGVCV